MVAKKAPAKKVASKKAPPKVDGAPPKMGRPTLRTPENAETICEQIASGKSARVACEKAGISQTMLWVWLKEDADFRGHYTRAREVQADFYADEIIEISDDGRNDTYTDFEGEVRANAEVVARSKLRVDSRKWYASKLAPKKYSERQQVDVDMSVTVKTEELDERIEALMRKAAGGR